MKKTLRLSAIALLTTFMLGTSPEAVAWGPQCPNGHFNVQRYVYNITYPNATYHEHQCAVQCAYICNNCHVGWTDVEYYSEPHKTPNNEACVCGFVPPQM